MTREEQICSQSVRYTKETHSPSSTSEFQAAMNIAVVKAFTVGAKWADETMLKEVLEWLENRTIDTADEYEDPIVAFTIFGCKEQMLQSFKERFNVE